MLALSFVSVVAVIACGRDPSLPTSTSKNPTSVRIVSLSPGLTSTITALGAGDRLVGRTPWCENAAAVPVVGTLLDLDAEALVAARPTLVIVQPPAQGEPAVLSTLVAQHGWRVERFRIDSLADVLSSIDRLPAMICDPLLLGDCDLMTARASEVRQSMLNALEPIADASRAGRTLVALVGSEGADVMGFGEGSYIGDALVRMGMINALTRSGYPALGGEDVVKLAPDSVVIIASRPSGSSEQLRMILSNSTIVRIEAPELLQPGGGMVTGLIKLRAAFIDACAHRTSAP